MVDADIGWHWDRFALGCGVVWMGYGLWFHFQLGFLYFTLDWAFRDMTGKEFVDTIRGHKE